MSTEEAITRAELAAALRGRLNGYADPAGAVVLYDPDKAAADIFECAVAGREPVYPVGDLFEDADGRRWYRTGLTVASSGLPWRDVITCESHREERPVRPLRRLIPEGARTLALADHGDVLAEVLRGTSLPRPEAIDLAWRICKLMGGECDGR